MLTPNKSAFLLPDSGQIRAYLVKNTYLLVRLRTTSQTVSACSCICSFWSIVNYIRLQSSYLLFANNERVNTKDILGTCIYCALLSPTITLLSSVQTTSPLICKGLPRRIWIKCNIIAETLCAGVKIVAKQSTTDMFAVVVVVIDCFAAVFALAQNFLVTIRPFIEILWSLVNTLGKQLHIKCSTKLFNFTYR